MRCEHHLKVKVASRRTAQPRPPLAGETDTPPFRDSFWDLHVESARSGDDTALIVQLRNLKQQTACRAAVGVFKRNLDLGMQVFALYADVGIPTTCSAMAGSAEQRLEKIAEFARVGISAAGKVDIGLPVGRRPELLPFLPVRAKAIVGRAFLRVLEHLVGLLDLLEALFCFRLVAHVRMVFARQPPVRTLDLLRVGVTLDT